MSTSRSHAYRHHRTHYGLANGHPRLRANSPGEGPDPRNRAAALGSLYPAVLALITIALLVTMPGSSQAASAPKRAVWAEHDLTIELQHLPRPYSCSALNYKIHDILETIGARANMRVEASRCGTDLASSQVAPWVHMIFSLPFEVRGQLASSADMFAVERSVRIEPGSPPSIDSLDCHLLRQLELTLFAEIPMRIDGDHLSCQLSAIRHTPFSLSLDVLMPTPEPAKVSLPRPPSSPGGS